MERNFSYDYTQSPPRTNTPPPSSARLQRQRGSIVYLAESLGTGLIETAGQQLPFRLIDVIGSQFPQTGDAVSFGLFPVEEGHRAIQVVLDSSPQVIPGQGSLRDCYQAQAQQRSARVAQQQALRSKSSTGDALEVQLKYLRCDECQKLVQPKLVRKKNLLGLGVGHWSNFCPYCKSALDDTAPFMWRHPVVLMVLLAALISWWRW